MSAIATAYTDVPSGRRLSWAAEQIKAAQAGRGILGRNFQILPSSAKAVNFLELSQDLQAFYRTSDNPKKHIILEGILSSLPKICEPARVEVKNAEDHIDSQIQEAIAVESHLALDKIHDKVAAQKQRELSLLYFIVKLVGLRSQDVIYREGFCQARISLSTEFQRSSTLITRISGYSYQFFPRTLEGLAFACKWSGRFGDKPGIFEARPLHFSPREKQELEKLMHDENQEVRFMAASLFVSLTAHEVDVKSIHKQLAMPAAVGRYIIENCPMELAFLKTNLPWAVSFLPLGFGFLDEIDRAVDVCKEIRNAEKNAQEPSFCSLYEKLYKELQKIGERYPKQRIAFIQQFCRFNFPGHTLINEKNTPLLKPEAFRALLSPVKAAALEPAAIVASPAPSLDEAASRKKKAKKHRGGKSQSHVHFKGPSLSASAAPAQAERVPYKAERKEEGPSPEAVTKIKQALKKHAGFPFKELTDEHFDLRVLAYRYSEIDHSQREQHFRHGFTSVVDHLVGSERYCYHTKIEKENGQIHDLYVLFGVIIRDGSKEPEPIVIHYCLGSDKKFYHVYISVRTNVQMLEDMILAARGKYNSPTPKEAEVLKGVFKKGAQRNDGLPHIGPMNIACIRDENFGVELRLFERPFS